MHGSIRSRLEDLLTAEQPAAGREAMTAHLSSCPECLSELEEMKAQARMFRSLRAPESAEPMPGFYARVLQRIEERTKESIWAWFVYSPIATRFAYASLTMVVLLGSYMLAQESRDGHLSGQQSTLAQTLHYAAPVEGS